MKKIFISIFCLSFLCTSAQAFKTYSYDSQGNRVYTSYNGGYQTYDENGAITGRVRQFSGGKTIVYDNNGNITKKYVTPLNGNTYIHDIHGNIAGRHNSYYTGQQIIYDNNGNQIGTVRTLPPRRARYYNTNRISTKVRGPVSSGTTIRHGIVH